MSRNADAAISVIWKMAFHPSVVAGQGSYPHEQVSNMPFDEPSYGDVVSDPQRGTSPEYPDLRHASTAGPAGPPPEHSEHDIDRIAAERSREDEALLGHERTSLWRRLFRRRG